MKDLPTVIPRQSVPQSARKVVENDTSEYPIPKPRQDRENELKSPRSHRSHSSYTAKNSDLDNESCDEISHSETASHTNPAFSEQASSNPSLRQTPCKVKRHGAKRSRLGDSEFSISSQLQDLDEDIEQERFSRRDIHSKLNAVNENGAHLVAQILVENEAGFTSNMDYFLNKSLKPDSSSSISTPEEYVKVILSFVRKLTLTCQGLLAGTCVWHIVLLTFYTSGDVTELFGFAARAYQGAFTAVELLVLFTFLQSCDSYSNHCLSWKVVIFFTNLVALFISVSMVKLDDQLWVMSRNATSVSIFNGTNATKFDYDTWYRLHYCRNVGAIQSFVVTIFDALILERFD